MISRPDETYGENWWRYEQTAYACATGWFDLLGRKLAGKPTQKGVYINKGKKQVVNTESCIFIR